MNTRNLEMLKHAEDGNLSSLQAVIKAGADFANFRDAAWESALHKASRKGHSHIVTYLLTLPGINPLIQGPNGETPRQYARFASAPESIKYQFDDAVVREYKADKLCGTFGDIQAHLANGFNVNHRRPGTCHTMLHEASLKGDYTMVTLLGKQPGIQLLIQSSSGETARQYARFASQAAQQCLEAAFNSIVITATRENKLGGDFGDFQSHLADGFDINFQENGTGATVIHTISDRTDDSAKQVRDALPSHPEVKLDIQDAKGVSAKDKAQQSGNSSTAQFFEKMKEDREKAQHAFDCNLKGKMAKDAQLDYAEFVKAAFNGIWELKELTEEDDDDFSCEMSKGVFGSMVDAIAEKKAEKAHQETFKECMQSKSPMPNIGPLNIGPMGILGLQNNGAFRPDARGGNNGRNHNEHKGGGGASHSNSSNGNSSRRQ